MDPQLWNYTTNLIAKNPWTHGRVPLNAQQMENQCVKMRPALRDCMRVIRRGGKMDTLRTARGKMMSFDVFVDLSW